MPTKQMLRQQLETFSQRIDAQPDPSSHKTLVDSINDTDRRRSDFWLAPPSGTSWRKPRTIAYLCAYVATFGPRFAAGATQTDDGGVFVPDVSVMKALLDGHCIGLDSGQREFYLTSKGQALIEPFVSLNHDVSH
jgi:hypothetical protein